MHTPPDTHCCCFPTIKSYEQNFVRWWAYPNIVHRILNQCFFRPFLQQIIVDGQEPNFVDILVPFYSNCNSSYIWSE